jgi:hypothetical protein
MLIVSVILYVFWAFVFVVSANRLYEVIKYPRKVSFREGVLITAMLIMPVWFYISR